MKKHKTSCGCFCDFYDDLRGRSLNFEFILVEGNPVPIEVGVVPETAGTLTVHSITLTKIDRETCCAHFVVVTSFIAPGIEGFPPGIYTTETVIDCKRIVSFAPLSN
ncbi:hypothetical protein [Sutcliffiella deserti]|uniref:hypothetical protein n=1 Tax=Sutcliffiella deserti TaxID=2875501 RepID=UPI001CBD8285|nr:hypothetical protein [Sutcliffiella deserti]